MNNIFQEIGCMSEYTRVNITCVLYLAKEPGLPWLDR